MLVVYSTVCTKMEMGVGQPKRVEESLPVTGADSANNQQSSVVVKPFQEQPTSTSEPLRFYNSNPDQEISLSEDNNIYDNSPTTRVTTYREFFNTLLYPDPERRTKDGPGFLSGPCNGLRRQVNIPYLTMAVLDADASVDAKGNRVEGAPPAREVHQALVEFNLSHLLYTTHSHGSDKGHRYRIVFPTYATSRGELRGLMIYICELISTYKKLPIYLTKESVTWGGRWHYPRINSRDAPFYSSMHIGLQPDPTQLARMYGVTDPGGNDIRTTLPAPGNLAKDPNSIISQFCRAFPLPELMSLNGYQYCGQGVIINSKGEEATTLRFKPIDSDSSPGIVVLDHEGRWKAYSHHGNDSLANGKLNDSFDFYFNCLDKKDQTQRFVVAADLLQDHYLEKMNVTNPVVMDGGSRFRIGMLLDSEFGGKTYKLLKFEDFKNRMAKEAPVMHGGLDEEGSLRLSAKSRAEWWKENPLRKSYDGTIFHPTPITAPATTDYWVGETLYFNLFRGWGIKPKPGDCSKIVWHIKNVLCSNQKEEYEYLLDWLAHMVQYPEEKPNVAVVFRSGKGTGKSIITTHMARAMGSLAMIIAHRRQLTGNFNAHFSSRLLAVFEEAFWAGNPEDEGPLKHLISEEITTVEGKGIDATGGFSFVRVMMSTNNDWAIPASSDERRYFLPTVSNLGIERQNQEGDYFKNLAGELSSGGLSSFFHLLATRSIDKDQVRYPPGTKGLSKQKLLSLTGLQAWIYDALMLGYFEDYDGSRRAMFSEYPKNTEVPVDLLLSGSKRYLQRNETHRSVASRILTNLSEYFGPVKTEKRGDILIAILPGFETCREKFAERMGFRVTWDRHQ